MGEAIYESWAAVQSTDADPGKSERGRIVKYDMTFEVTAVEYKTRLETKKKAPVGSSV
jgi:hypothetical protein